MRQRKNIVTCLTMVMVSLACGQLRASGPEIDPEADAVLRSLRDHSKLVSSAVIRLSDSIDDIQADGRKIQFSHLREITIVRPGKLKVVTRGDVSNRTLWKDGTTITVLDNDKDVFAQLTDPGTIDQAIEFLQDQYGMSLPAADLLSTDIYETMKAACTFIQYIGMSKVGVEDCHHLAFTGDLIDWQMWITSGDNPITRKMVITYKLMPGEPQYTMLLLDVEELRNPTDDVFACQIPETARRIDIIPVKKR